MLVNIVGLLYGGAMLVNFAWPRSLTNMTPDQTGGALDFHIGFLDKIPILWTVLIVIVAVGAVYYLITGRRKEVAPIMTPSPDDPIPATGAAA